jgi:hypothetical protein
MEERIIESTDISIDGEITKALQNVNIKNLPITYEESENLSLVKNNGFEVVDAIKNTDLITEKDVQNIKKAQTFLLNSYKDVPIYNTRIAKLTSILNDTKFPTNDSKYWQCKMQSEVHFNEFIRNIYKLEKVKIDIDELTYQIEALDQVLKLNEGSNFDKIKLSFDKKRLQIKLKQYIFETKLLEKDTKQRIREINEWVEIATVYEAGCTHSTSEYEEHTYATILQVLKTNYENAKSLEERNQKLSEILTIKRLFGKVAEIS